MVPIEPNLYPATRVPVCLPWGRAAHAQDPEGAGPPARYATAAHLPVGCAAGAAKNQPHRCSPHSSEPPESVGPSRYPQKTDTPQKSRNPESGLVLCTLKETPCRPDGSCSDLCAARWPEDRPRGPRVDIHGWRGWGMTRRRAPEAGEQAELRTAVLGNGSTGNLQEPPPAASAPGQDTPVPQSRAHTSPAPQLLLCFWCSSQSSSEVRKDPGSGTREKPQTWHYLWEDRREVSSSQSTEF